VTYNYKVVIVSRFLVFLTGFVPIVIVIAKKRMRLCFEVFMYLREGCMYSRAARAHFRRTTGWYYVG
jgi:hypothetical protein